MQLRTFLRLSKHLSLLPEGNVVKIKRSSWSIVCLLATYSVPLEY